MLHIYTESMQPATGETDTPKTRAPLTELGIFKETTFEHIVSLTQRHVDFTKGMERENIRLKKQLAAMKLLEDAARKIVRVHGNGQPKQLDDAFLLLDVALKECEGARK